MDFTELSVGSRAFDDAARSLVGDGNKLIRAVAELIKRGGRDDCERIAAVLAVAPIGGAENGDYYAARYGSSFDKRYLDMFLDICRDAGIPESEYIKVLLAAGSADKDGALYRWNSAVDVYLTRRANEDYELIADYIDRFDTKYIKYGVLIRLDAPRALRRLVGKVLYGKNIDKTAIRDILMDHTELSVPLMTLYGESKARERAAVARLLLLYKNDLTVSEFLKEVVGQDKSKTVRGVLPHAEKIKKSKDAPMFFERVLSEGETFTVEEWRDILKDADYAAVADRVFFYTSEGVETRVLVYDKGEFLDMTDKPANLPAQTSVGVLHPSDVPSGCDVLTLRINQPIEQLRRRTFGPPRGELFSSALCGTITERGDFEREAVRQGFTACGKRTVSEPNTLIKFIGDYCIGVEYDLSKSSDTVACGRLAYYKKQSVVKLNKTYFISTASPLACDAVPRRIFSELTLYAYRLFGV